MKTSYLLMFHNLIAFKFYFVTDNSFIWFKDWTAEVCVSILMADNRQCNLKVPVFCLMRGAMHCT